ncbi:MAG: hypothetical protein ACRENT_05940 [Thermodesulfobacteriota bacterium]
MNPYLIIIFLLAIIGLGIDDFRHYAAYVKEKAAYAQFVSDVKLAAAMLKRQHDKDFAAQETKHAQERADILLAYEREFIKLRDESSRPRGLAPRPATICDDSAGNQRLSDALRDHHDGLRAALGEARQRTLQLLKSAELQTETLRRCQGYVGTD